LARRLNQRQKSTNYTRTKDEKKGYMIDELGGGRAERQIASVGVCWEQSIKGKGYEVIKKQGSLKARATDCA
jgi:hypothetical protein